MTILLVLTCLFIKQKQNLCVIIMHTSVVFTINFKV